MDNLNNNSNNDNLNNDNSNNDNSNNNENPNIRTFYFNPTQTNEDIIQQITSFINNISNINQVNQENNINSLGENNNDLSGLGGLGGLGSPDINQNIQMFFEIEFLIDNENAADDEAPHFDNCNHINEILGKAIYIKNDDPILQTDCSICMDNYKYKQYKRILPECKHTFHKKCIDNWFKKNSSCPVCRKDFLTIQNNAS